MYSTLDAWSWRPSSWRRRGARTQEKKWGVGGGFWKSLCWDGSSFIVSNNGDTVGPWEGQTWSLPSWGRLTFVINDWRRKILMLWWAFWDWGENAIKSSNGSLQRNEYRKRNRRLEIQPQWSRLGGRGSNTERESRAQEREVKKVQGLRSRWGKERHAVLPTGAHEGIQVWSSVYVQDYRLAS